MDACSQTGLAADVDRLRDEELYLQLFRDHIAGGALTMLKRKLKLIEEEIQRSLAALAEAEWLHWLPPIPFLIVLSVWPRWVGMMLWRARGRLVGDNHRVVRMGLVL